MIIQAKRPGGTKWEEAELLKIQDSFARAVRFYGASYFIEDEVEIKIQVKIKSK